MRDIADQSVHCIITDLPYGTTRNGWDSVIPLDELWEQFRRIIHPRGAIVMFAQQPFSSVLACSNLPWFRYEWIWVKESGTGHLNSKFAPMKSHEQLLIFSPSGAGNCNRNPECAMRYYPQYRSGKPYSITRNGRCSANYDVNHYKATETHNDGQHYFPIDTLYFSRDKDSWHPTQKPLDLVRYLIMTYSAEGDTILDVACGSGTTCVAAIRERRHFIGFEIDEGIFTRAQQRIAEASCDLFFNL